MYDKGLTDYNTKAQFKSEKNIRRDEASKFITEFAQTVLEKQWTESSICYMFSDVPNSNKLRDYMVQSCELWYMKGKNNKFNPGWYLSNAQAIAIVIRMSEWVLDEPKSDRSKNYYKKANELWLLDWLSLLDRRQYISRWKFATLLYRVNQNIWDSNLREDSQAISEEFGNFDEILSSWLNTMLNAMIDFLGFKVNSHSGINSDFINKATLCTSWTSNTTETDFDMLWMNFYMKMYREIRWREWSKCIVYERIDGATVNIPTKQIQSAIASGYTTQQEADLQIAEMQTLIQKSIGKDWLCKYPISFFTAELAKELSWDFNPMPDDNLSEYCTWSIFSGWL